VQIIDEEQKSSRRGERLEEARGVVEEPQALLARRERSVGGERSELGLDFRRQLGDLGRGGAERRAQLVGAAPARPLAERFDHGQVGRRRFVFVAAAAQHSGTALLRMGDQFLRQTRLANAGLSRKQHEVTARLLRSLPLLLQLQRFRRAIDQPSAHELLQRRGRGCTRILDTQWREV